MHIFHHAQYLYQIIKLDFSHACSGDGKPCDMFVSTIPKEKWQKKRTQVKIRVSCWFQINSAVALCTIMQHAKSLKSRFRNAWELLINVSVGEIFYTIRAILHLR